MQPGRALGVTLLELLMVCVLSLLLLGLLVAFLIPAARATVKGSARVELEQQVLVLINRLSVDLQRTVPQAVTVSGRQVGIIPYRDLDPDGTLLWESSLLVWGWGGPGQSVLRKTWEAGQPPTLAFQPDPSRINPVTPDDLSRVMAASELPYKVMAREVDDFSLTLNGRRADLAVRLKREGNDPQVFELKRSFAMRTVP